MNNGKHGQGTHSTKMAADSLAKNTSNASKNFSPKCLPKHKSLRFSKKLSLGVRSPCIYIKKTIGTSNATFEWDYYWLHSWQKMGPFMRSSMQVFDSYSVIKQVWNIVVLFWAYVLAQISQTKKRTQSFANLWYC